MLDGPAGLTERYRMADVVLQNVRKVYDSGFVAVKELSLGIADGEFVVLVGPSGCGKSTTLRLIAGLEDADGGTIAIGGRVVNDVEPKDRDIAMVFQNYALYPHMTVYENMAFALKLRKVPKPEIERRVREAARTLGIEELLGRKPRALSGGQRQRVAVGRAIVREPKAFLFDEPLSNLDAKLRVTTRAELKGLHQRLKTTTVYVTHDQEEAMTLGDRVVVMHGGVIQQQGSPMDVYRRPANRFVAAFIGMPPMNFIAGHIDARGGGPAFREGETGGEIPLAADRFSALRSRGDKPVVLGVRPQNLRIEEAGAAGSPGFGATVRVVEPLGDTMDVVCATPTLPHFVARVAAREDIEPGQELRLIPTGEGVHVFEPGEFGVRLA
jgi:multiple sugar transport system ATP-binding protein